MELNQESILDALNDFEKKSTEIPPILEDYLLRIAKNGEILFPWCKLKPLLKKKLELVLDEFYETCPVEISVPVPNFEAFNFETLKKTILQAVESFTSAPFTIQRLCELVTDPKKHYNRTDKYMRGIEKNVLVVSTVEPRSGIQLDGNNGNVVNGLVSDSPRSEDCFNGHETSTTPANLNTPANHVLLENFANVFPSAACIPSASNMCINREIEENFINPECVETSEVAFESTIQEQAEMMDTKPDEQSEPTEKQPEFTEVTSDSSSSDSDQNSSAELAFIEQVTTEQKLPEEALDSSDASDENDNTKNEAESTEPSLIFDKEPEKAPESPQDNTVSQSDEKPDEITVPEIPDDDDASVETPSDSETTSEVVPSEEPSEISDNAMEIEIPTTSDEATA